MNKYRAKHLAASPRIAPRRRPPFPGAIDTGAILLRRARDGRSRRLTGFYRLVFQKAQAQAGRAVRGARRAPRRVYRRMRVSGDSGDGGDGDGEPAPSLAFSVSARPSGFRTLWGA